MPTPSGRWPTPRPAGWRLPRRPSRARRPRVPGDSPGAFCHPPAMIRFVAPYALALALAVVALEWLRYRHVTRIDSTEVYVAILALAFIALGIWVGRRLTPQPRPAEFTRNDAAIRSLGLTERECDI